jgi:predicted ATP-dependent endonuclease of OLD family
MNLAQCKLNNFAKFAEALVIKTWIITGDPPNTTAVSEFRPRRL